MIITIILIIILLVMLFATSGKDEVTGAQSVVGSIFAPMQEGLYDATNAIGGFFSRLFAGDDLRQENDQLKQKVAELEGKLQEYNNIVSENQRLKDLLNVADSVGDYEVVTAKVIGNTPGAWFREFTVNAGRNKGIETGMIVMTKDGLMGQVVSVSDTYCKVMSIIDAESGVPGIVERTRDYGVVGLAGGDEGNGDMLEMSYLPLEADIIPGDKILTSGIGGIYPKGLVIGQVAEVGAATETGEKKVIVKSAVDFQHVEEVVIIKYLFEEVEE
ncbi:MAG: rod shape-determining protein MreC [Christensenellaceae bacterium]|nr:rod shape-determining protein MreC [Christensenellaceae bacterium]